MINSQISCIHCKHLNIKHQLENVKMIISCNLNVFERIERGGFEFLMDSFEENLKVAQNCKSYELKNFSKKD